MKIYDVSSTIYEGMPVWENSPDSQPKITTQTNGYVTVSNINMGVHTGTHVDAPLHMLPGGDPIDTIQVKDLIRYGKVFDLTHVEDQITKNDLASLQIEKDDFIILKTKNSDSFNDDFDFNFIYVTEDAANYLIEIGISGIGIDSLGIERAQEGHPTHRMLFKNDVIIIEGLRLKDISEGKYFMVAAPLKIKGTDGSPARVVLMEGIYTR